MNKTTECVSEYYEGNKKGEPFNSYFDKIFIINLHDKTERFNKVSKRFSKVGVKYERFIAIDGRCEEKCKNKKRKEFEERYDLEIDKSVPPSAASLVIGHIEILKMQVRNKWKHVLVCEDDVNFDKESIQTFKKGIIDIPKRWDVLYLGCGNLCGDRGISFKKTRENKYKTSLSIVSDEYHWYVKHKDDLRTISEDKIKHLSEYLSIPISPGGNWSACYSLSGAKKILKYINNNINNHIDQILIRGVAEKVIKAISFDPPIMYHEEGALRPDTSIEWEW